MSMQQKLGISLLRTRRLKLFFQLSPIHILCLTLKCEVNVYVGRVWALCTTKSRGVILFCYALD